MKRIFIFFLFLSSLLSSCSSDDKIQSDEKKGKVCGGINGEKPPNDCPKGYYCKYEDNNPDGSGVCTKKYL